MKLNGWVRIGIVASVLWIPFGCWYVAHKQEETDAALIQMSVSTEFECETHEVNIAPCVQDADRFVASLSSPEAMSALRKVEAFVAFGPIPVAWGLVFLIVGVCRWIKRGFANQ